MIMAGWDDVPHLSEEDKENLMSSLPAHQRSARSKGIPSLGAGAIYPVPEDEIKCDPFEIPDYFKKAFGLDVGWNKTAAVFGAIDPDSDILYLTSMHYRGHAEPSVHAAAIRARGEWIPGAIDPASRGRSQKDGEALIDIYLDLGIDINPAINSVESGLYAVLERLSTGRLKVFSILTDWFTEYRVYQRDKNGKVKKSNDHAMDATRYLVMSGLELAKTKPFKKAERSPRSWRNN